jgi:Amt family ammonium transporter
MFRHRTTKLMALLSLLAGLSLGSLVAQTTPAPAAPPAPTPTLEQRVAGLEAYLGNG